MSQVLLTPQTDASKKKRIKEALERLESPGGPSRVSVLKQMLSAFRFNEKRFQNVSIFPPSKVVFGVEDRFVSPKNSQFVATLLGYFSSEAEGVTAGGHEVYLEKTEECIALVRRFFSQH